MRYAATFNEIWKGSEGDPLTLVFLFMVGVSYSYRPENVKVSLLILLHDIWGLMKGFTIMVKDKIVFTIIII